MTSRNLFPVELNCLVWGCVCFHWLTVVSEWPCPTSKLRRFSVSAGQSWSGKEHGWEDHAGPVLLLTSCGHRKKAGEDQNKPAKKLFPFFLDTQVSIPQIPLLSPNQWLWVEWAELGTWRGRGEGACEELCNVTYRFTGGFGGLMVENTSLFCSNGQTFIKADFVPGFRAKGKYGMVPALSQHVASDFWRCSLARYPPSFGECVLLPWVVPSSCSVQSWWLCPGSHSHLLSLRQVDCPQHLDPH